MTLYAKASKHTVDYFSSGWDRWPSGTLSSYRPLKQVNNSDFSSSTAVVVGASGQDGYFLTECLLEENWKVHATVRRSEALEKLAESEKVRGQLQIHHVDLENPGDLFDLIARQRPE